MRTDHKRIWFEVIGLYALGLVVLYGTGLLAALGSPFAENQGAITAAYFLLVPIALQRFRGRDPAAMGIHGRRFLASLAVAFAAAAIVFPPYVAGFEAWSRLRYGAGFDLPEHPLSYFPAELRGRPDLTGPFDDLKVWVEGERLMAVYGGTGRVNVAIEGCGCPARRLLLEKGRLRFKGEAGSCEGEGPRIDMIGGTGASCPTNDHPGVTIDAQGEGPVRILAGRSSGEGRVGRASFDRSAWWLMELLLLHLVVVAFPEEVFFRGYVQTRLSGVFRRRWRLFGVSIGWHVVVASALFAASHLVAIPSAYRLAVFFPGLLFGFLREKTGSIVAPAILHALSNVLLEVLVRYHGV